ncbi:MAG TPA: alpha-amylase family protein [Chloroflexota bacterium]|nr:alpha-amylase family protein [Chloroflexota bacterium]
MTSTSTPWYRRVYRWGQTNLTEIDPIRYDPIFWIEQWQRTQIQGIIVNAGGIVAYYPTKYPLHHRALYLNDRDLYGEIVAAAREQDLAVLARMDSNRADERFFVEHPDWFAVDAEGKPYREGELYVACVNSPYYDEHIPAILTEIIERSHPEGITDNSWSGLTRDRICYCRNCARKFHEATGYCLPKAKDWESPVYRQWIKWNYARRIEIWDLNNRTTKAAGGPDCLWIGMNAGDILSQSQRFRDYRAICERAEIIMLDSQARTNAKGFQSNGEMAKLIHGILGWEKLIPESMAMYQAGQPTFRLASKPEPEARLWVVEGMAGGLQPWWHHIGAYHEDRRQYRTAEPLWHWHAVNQEYLVDRRPVATVGVVWSQENVDFYGRDVVEERVALPQRGLTNALLRARIPYLLIHVDQIDQAGNELGLLILPNLGALSDRQCTSIRRFVERGGSLIASGETSLYNEWGDPRPDFALADILGVHATGAHHGSERAVAEPWDAWGKHTYLRLSPELRAQVIGPQVGIEPPIFDQRHPVLAGFDETDILPFGGRLEVVRPDAKTTIPLTFIPPFPIYPPETAWMGQATSSLPALVLRELPSGGRVAYLAADIDRCFGRDNLPDHADLLANLVRWIMVDRLPLRVTGPGLIDCHLYRQSGRLILHLVNLTCAGTWRAPVHELIPVGPLHVEVRLPEDIPGNSVSFLVADRPPSSSRVAGWVHVEIPPITDHEVVLIE